MKIIKDVLIPFSNGMFFLEEFLKYPELFKADRSGTGI